MVELLGDLPGGAGSVLECLYPCCRHSAAHFNSRLPFLFSLLDKEPVAAY